MGLDILLEDVPESAYWMGLLFADGYIEEKRITITLAAKDTDYLSNYAKYIGSKLSFHLNGIYPCVRVSRQEPLLVSQIIEKFDIKKRKTYNPPKKLPYSDDNLKCFLMGLIDGDGTITYQSGRKSVCLRTTSHPSWEPFLQNLSTETDFGKVVTRNDGYIQLGSFKHKEIVALKEFGVEKQLPLLERKWDRVDTKLTVRGSLQYDIIELIEEGLRPQEIIKITGCSEAYVSVLKKRLEKD